MKNILCLTLVILFSWLIHPSTSLADGVDCAIYQVPVNDQSLAPYAIYPLPHFSITRASDGDWAARYLLPLELTGEANQLEFTAPPADEPTRFDGPNGVMECDHDQCAVRFKNLAIAPTKVETYLKSLKLSDVELAARLKVSDILREDPGGTLYYGPCPR